MSEAEWHKWEAIFERAFVQEQAREPGFTPDPAHDLSHLHRVVGWAKKLAKAEGADFGVVIPAAWFHDVVNLPKNSPNRSRASQLSAQRAVEILKELNYPGDFPAIAHAVEAHSFSANIECRSLEARVVQDADRLDGLGAIGIARCFAVGGKLARPFYSEIDPLGENGRPFDDRIFTVDHFYVKLFGVAKSLKTAAARTEGENRVRSMQSFLKSLSEEIGSF